MKVFVDTSFLIALTDKSDKHADNAQDCFLTRINEGVELFSNNAILSETITWLRYHAGFKYAREFGEKFRHSKIIKTIWIDSDLEKEAWEVFLKYSDKDLSYVDCLSFACMKTNRINHAFTFDKHFQQVGFNTLL